MKKPNRSLLCLLPVLALMGLSQVSAVPSLQVTTSMATNVDAFTASLNGSFVPAFGSIWFEYGTGSTGAFGFVTPHQTISGMPTFTAALKGLKPATAYHFRAVGQVAGSAPVYGSDLAFMTPASVLISVDPQMPAALLLATGSQGASLSVTAHGSSPSFQWLKGTAPVTGATAATYNFPAITPAMAGSYACKVSNPLNSVTSSPATLVSVASISPSTALLVKSGGTFTLKASVVPASPQFTYAWSCTKSLAMVGTVSGQGTPTLTITNAAAAPMDTYSCLITLGKLSTTVSVPVTVLDKPVITGLAPLSLEVGQPVSLPLVVSNQPSLVTVTGLPAGLRLEGDPDKPIITGSTLAATSANGVTVTVNARNVAGSADPVKFTITVQALNPRTVQTTFNGLVDRDPVAADNGNLGGALTNLVVTPTGAYTGVLSLGNLPAIRFSGQLVVPNVGDNPTSTAILIGLLLPAVQKFTLDFTIDASTGKLTGTLQKFGDMARPTPVTAWGNPYSAVHPNAGLAGLHNFWMDPPAKGSGGSVSPGGASVGTATISAHGVVAVYVSMGDGSVFPTFTTTIGMNGEVPLHGILYKGKGSFHGSLAILDTNDVSLPPLAYHTVTGSVSWNKTGATGNADHTYAAGFDFGATNTDLLTVAGSEQEAESGVIFWGIPDVDSPVPNAMITFSGGGITDSAVLAALNASFHIITGAGAGGGPHVLTNFDIIVAAGAGGGPHVKRSLTLNNVTGAINGTFTLTDVLMGPTGVQTVQRTATFTGVVAPGLRLGHGFFTLVQLPGTATSDVFSGPFDFVAVQSK